MGRRSNKEIEAVRVLAQATYDRAREIDREVNPEAYEDDHGTGLIVSDAPYIDIVPLDLDNIKAAFQKEAAGVLRLIFQTTDPDEMRVAAHALRAIVLQHRRIKAQQKREGVIA